MLFDVEEASRSQSECETEDSNASPGKHSAAESAAPKARDEEQSDDSTDMEDSETIKQNVVHAGDGDKADGTLLPVFGRCVIKKLTVNCCQYSVVDKKHGSLF